MAFGNCALFFFWSLIIVVNGANFPTGCSYHDEVDSVHLYKCTFGSVTLPLTYSTFSDPLPQWIQITKINGNMNAGSFTGFGSYDTTKLSHDKNPTLQLFCTTGGSLNLQSTSFNTLGYIQEVEISNCNVNLPANVFSPFGTLNRLTISGGTLTLNAATFEGLTIAPIDKYADAAGELTIKDLTLSGGFPANVFTPINQTRSIRVENVGLTSIAETVFSSNTGLHSLSLKGNSIVDTIPTTFFKGLDGLVIFDQTSFQWTCTCDNVWWWPKASLKNITIQGAAICSGPADVAGTLVGKYYDQNCVTSSVCGDTMGVAIGSTCLPLGHLVGFGLIFVMLIICIVSLACILHMRKNALAGPVKKTRKGPPPPGAKKGGGGGGGGEKKQRRGSGWV
ncbi:SLIT and NTRK-like protein 5 [Saccostrea echinata]|uniref:SLIT and NTRK-like protein 5 n=1 Tax=Saccostrea echinata TaxID=191078 RepID=UPI002A8187B4|nr:SLIT and NTRK-like protein 5 [Saccostrea echinata]